MVEHSSKILTSEKPPPPLLSVIILQMIGKEEEEEVKGFLYKSTYTNIPSHTRILSHIHTSKIFTALAIKYMNDMNTTTHTFTHITISLSEHSYTNSSY